jgi:RES domain-containing protein
MMKAYRISRSKYIKDLSGIGAKLYGGRWNPKGMAVLYTSENKSLAALEILVHFDRSLVPDELQIITINLPKGQIASYDELKYQKILSSKESHTRFKEEGRSWIESKTSLGLKVPSVLISGEYNIIINPEHELFKEIEIEKIEDFTFDERFFI